MEGAGGKAGLARWLRWCVEPWVGRGGGRVEGERGRGGSARSWGLESAIRLSRYRDALSAVSAHSPALTRTGSQALGQGSEPVRSERSTPGASCAPQNTPTSRDTVFSLSLFFSFSLSLSHSFSLCLSHFFFHLAVLVRDSFATRRAPRVSLNFGAPLVEDLQGGFRDEDQRGHRDESMERRLVGFG